MLDYMHVGVRRPPYAATDERGCRAMSKAQEQGEQEAESLYLKQTVATARRQWMLARQRVHGQEADISSAYEDMQEYVTHEVSGLYSMQGFHDLVELSQYAMPVSGQISAHEAGVQAIRTLERMMDSPYFARIDFRFDGDEAAEKIYIGRATLMDQQTMSIYVHDWRAPISSMFYRFGIGRASYKAPSGTVHGEMSLKRQYEIQRGELCYFFDADVQIIDEYLRQLLSRPASPNMKTIVETIQRDQDIVIRDMENDVLMVQGAAGSGKTSIALHRIAYLTYQGLGSRLNANDILILSPNTVFEEYISHVLPELGENHVKTLLFEDMFHKILPGVPIQSRGQCIEQLLATEDDVQAALSNSCAALKGSAAFIRMLDRLVLELPRKWIAYRDIDYAGQTIARRELEKTALCNSKKIAPLGVQLKWLESEILERAHGLRKRRMQKLEQFAALYPEHAMEVEAFSRWLSIRESAVLLREIKAFTHIDALAVYRRLFNDEKCFYRLFDGIPLPDNIEEIRRLTCSRLSGERLYSDDAQALLYLHIRIHGFGEYTHMRQVVLDEAQDEYPLYFAILRELFPYARYTILGDVNQTIGKQADISLYDLIGKTLGKEKSTLVSMEKSFRCTMEIWRFSTRFLEPGTAGQCFSRSGEEPAVHRAEDLSQMDEMLIREVAACKEKGHQSIGLIAKTERDAFALYGRLKHRLDVRLIHNGAMADIRGTLILPIYLAKGLEFDAVLVCGTDQKHYHAQSDKRLLYIACTRALHRLNLFYMGEISPLL